MSAPVNDNFANALELFFDTGFVNGTNAEATNESFDGNIKPVWYKWTAPLTGLAVFSTLQSLPNNQDTILRIYQGSTANKLIESDDVGSSPLSSAQFSCVAGQVYYIAVGGYAGQVVNFRLDWTSINEADRPSNDTYAGAVEIDGIFGSIIGTTQNAFGTDGYKTHMVWYLWTPDTAGSITFTLIGTMGGTPDVLDTFKGPTWADAVYQRPENFDQHDPNTVFITVPSVVGVPLHISVKMLDGGDPNFALSWKVVQPEVNPVSGVAIQSIASSYVTAYRIISNPLVNEVWAEQESTTKAIARFNEGSNELLGYIDIGEEAYDPIYFDLFNQRVWIPLRSNRITYVSALPPFTQGPIFNVQSYYGSAWSPIDGSWWTSARSSASRQIHRYNPNTGAFIQSYNVPYEVWDIQFAADGRMFLKLGENLYDASFNRIGVIDRVAAFDPATGVTTMLPIGNDDVARFAISNKRNSIFSLLYVEPFGSGNTLTEFSLDTNTTVATYTGLPFYNLAGFRYYYEIDELRNLVWMNHSDSGLVGAYDTATGELVHGFTIQDGGGSFTPTPSGVYLMQYDGFFKFTMGLPPAEGPINDRDVWLETYAERFEKVTVQPGADVINAQTSGTGTTVTGAKRLDLAASVQYFIVRAEPT